MSFEEYLMATENQKYFELALRREKGGPLPELCREPLEKAYKNYLITGGMPAAVAVWNETHDYSRVDEVLDGILAKYSKDFLRHAPASQVPKFTGCGTLSPGSWQRKITSLFSHTCGKENDHLNWRMR